MTELQNFIDGYGFGISVQKLAEKAYRHMESKGHKVCMVNERYLEVDGTTYLFSQARALDCKGFLKEGGMNIAEKMERESRLMTNLAGWMEKHGTVISDRQQSNAYTGVRIREIRWRGNTYQIIDVDGMTCRIERL